jgi:hypothetical protein
MEKGLIISTTTGTLLAAEKLRSSGYRTTRLYPAALAILNLFFCAYFERYLKNDFDGYYLSMFLFLECTLYVGVSSLSFVTTSAEILAKSRVFPLTAVERLSFVVTSNLRRPTILALTGSSVFFVMIVYPSTFSNTLASISLMIALMVLTETLLATTLLALARRSIPSGSAFALLGFLFVAFLVTSLIFHVASILGGIPAIKWATMGILAGGSGNTETIFIQTGWLLLTEVVVLAVARKVV